MAKLERTYTIPLQREWRKTPSYKRAKKAVAAVRQFLEKHMKSDEVKIGNFLNKELWARGIKNPPRKVKVTAVKDDEGIVRTELFGKEYIDVKAEMEKVEKKPAAEKKEDKPTAKAEKKKEEPAKKKEEKKEDKPAAKIEEKKEEPKKEALKEEKKKEVKKEKLVAKKE